MKLIGAISTIARFLKKLFFIVKCKIHIKSYVLYRFLDVYKDHLRKKDMFYYKEEKEE